MTAQLHPRILVVEDDSGLREVLARGLREEGYEVSTASDGRSALRTADAVAPLAAVILDIGLPDADGRDVCQALRARGVTAPVVFLTARDGLHDRLSGFAAGADDYLAKPFALAELMARLRAVVRRAPGAAAEVGGGLELDPVGHALRGPLAEVPLTPTEFRVLACLVAAPGAVVRRRELVRAGWPEGAIVADNTLDQYVARLRRKLTAAGVSTPLRTQRGVGYRYA